MRNEKTEFPSNVERIVKERAKNRCERCSVDFDDDFKGEFHHIIPVVYGGSNAIDNCSLLCYHCHKVAPDLKSKKELLFYHHYFLRFASFKEASQYYGVNTRLELSIKVSQDIAQTPEGKVEIRRLKEMMSNKSKDAQ